MDSHPTYKEGSSESNATQSAQEECPPSDEYTSGDSLWLGKRLKDMTKEELITALCHQAELYRRLLEEDRRIFDIF